MKHTLPALNYSYEALEPVIDARTMEIHHTKHHQAYIDNLNKALEGQSDLENKELTDLICHLNEVSDAIKTAIRNNGGGHLNHTLFWTWMSPDSLKNENNTPNGELLEKINQAFGSYDAFKEEFSKAAMGRFGSGWVWLCKTSEGSLKIVSTANQDNPIMGSVVGIEETLYPILGLDVWEHAYYLNYQNKRAEYVNNFWKIVNWVKIQEEFQNI